ncbi:MAG: rnpA [Hyphomicrobiales bacterium]|nr:rnpA [Hyphomicrobiales bacterium]
MTGSAPTGTASALDPDEGVGIGSRAAPRPERLLKRPDFLRVAKGQRFHATAFSLQALAADAAGGAQAPAPRFGLTVTRKAGGSVERNRMRRRLREALRRAAPLEARPGYDYVIVARREALGVPFDKLVDDLARAMRLIGSRRKESPRKDFRSAPPAPQAGA